MLMLLFFNLFLVTTVLLQLVQIGLLVFVAHRLIQDKNAAVTFLKSVWMQLQEDLINKLFHDVDEKKECVVNK
jgi:hypothetical protein